MTDHRITYGRDVRRYHTWTCSCGVEGELAFLRETARAEGEEHVARPNACRSCGSAIAADRTLCSALECGGRPLP